jgi:hypothetical protein
MGRPEKRLEGLAVDLLLQRIDPAAAGNVVTLPALSIAALDCGRQGDVTESTGRTSGLGFRPAPGMGPAFFRMRDSELEGDSDGPEASRAFLI